MRFTIQRRPHGIVVHKGLTHASSSHIHATRMFRLVFFPPNAVANRHDARCQGFAPRRALLVFFKFGTVGRCN